MLDSDQSIARMDSIDELELALDTTLESYLVALSTYQLAQSELAQHLKAVSVYFLLTELGIRARPCSDHQTC